MNLLRPAFLLVILAAGPVFAAPVPVDSLLTAATVYADRAVISRVAETTLPAGQSELVFTRLPAGLLDSSLQVSARGTAATILDVSARTAYVDTTVDPRALGLETELEALQRQDRACQDQLTTLEQQRALMAKIENAVAQPPPKDATAPRPTVDDWQKLLAFSSDNTNRIAGERRTLDLQRLELARKTAALEAQLNQLRGRQPARRATKSVTVRVAADRSGPLAVTLTYALPGASWTPAYDARLHSEERAVELTCFGVVRNGTGEDWSDIALTLSTARPQLGGAAPELQPWILDVIRLDLEGKLSRARLAPSQTVLGLGASSSQSFNLLAGEKSDAFADQASALALATLDTAATSASFKIPVAATILSDNTPQKVGIVTARLAATLRYQSTPRQLEAVFLSAYLTNSTEFPLLAGPVSTFLADTFVATSPLKTVMPGEKFEIALGADDGIAIKRRLVNRFGEDTGFTGKTRRTSYDWLITVTNNKRTAERVVFKDLLPVSRDEKIVVKLLAPAEKDVGTLEKPGREVTREEDGKLVWRLDLQPGEKREIPFKFTVEHPGELRVAGLE